MAASDRGVLAVALNEDLGGAEDAGAGGHAIPHLVESLQSKRACHALKFNHNGYQLGRKSAQVRSAAQTNVEPSRCGEMAYD